MSQERAAIEAALLLPPGRELDAAVAEHVLGWRWTEVIYDPGRWQLVHPNGVGRIWEIGTENRYPRPQDLSYFGPLLSTDLADAEPLIDLCEITSLQRPESGMPWEAHLPFNGKWICESGDTMPHAICRCALRWALARLEAGDEH